MTARKIKHQRMLEKRAKWMTTVKEGNLAVLRKVRDLREEERKRAEKELKERKIEKSKKLAAQNAKNAEGIQTYKPAPAKNLPRPNKKEN